MSRPIEDSANAKEFLENLAAADPLTPATKNSFRSLVGAIAEEEAESRYVRYDEEQTLTAEEKTLGRSNIGAIAEEELESRYVRYDEAQTLTAEEKTQGRANIGAIAEEELESRYVRYDEAQTLTAEEKTQGRANIGAIAEEEFESRYIRYDEEQTLTSEEKTQGRANLDVDPSEEVGSDLVDDDEVTIFPAGDKTARKSSLISRFWTYVAAKIDEGRTYAGNHTFTGQLSATGQTLDAGSKVISRDSLMEFMGSPDFFWWREEYHSWADFGNNSTLGGTLTISGATGVSGVARMRTGTTINGTAEAQLGAQLNIWPRFLVPWVWRDNSRILGSITQVVVRMGFSEIPTGTGGATTHFVGFDYNSEESPNWRFYDWRTDTYTDTGVAVVGFKYYLFKMRVETSDLDTIFWSIDGGVETSRTVVGFGRVNPVSMIKTLDTTDKSLAKDFTSLIGYPSRTQT